MAFEAQLRHGNPTFDDHTPGADVAAGTVVVTGDTPRIAHLDLPANKLGSLAARGGVYRVTGDAAIAANKKVYWNSTAKKVTETASGNKPFGWTEAACSGDGVAFDVRHEPAA